MSLRSLLPFVALVLSAGCGSTEPSNADHITTVQTFGAIGSDPTAADFASVLEGAATGTVRVTGDVKLPSACYTMNARATSSHQFVMVDVEAEETQGFCSAVVSQVHYTLDLAGLASGQRTVQVRHLIITTRSTATVTATIATVAVK